MNFNNDFRYDLEVGKEGERIIDSLFKDKLLEVKRDSWVAKSGNIAIEYESRGKPSGIATTEADYWVIIFSGDYKDKVIYIFETERLKQIARRYYVDGNTKAMGDNNSSMVVLIPIKEISNFVFND